MDKSEITLNLLGSKWIEYYDIYDSVISSPYFEKLINKKLSEEDIYEIKKDIINKRLIDSKIIFVDKFIKLSINNYGITLLSKYRCINDNIPYHDFIYAIHVKNMKNVRSIKLNHRYHGTLFEKIIDEKDEDISIPLATNEDIPKEMFFAFPKKVSIIPTTTRYDSSNDLEINLEPFNNIKNAQAEIILSVGYFNIHNGSNKPYMYLQSPQTGIPIYYINGKEIKASVHDNAKETLYLFDDKLKKLIEKCNYEDSNFLNKKQEEVDNKEPNFFTNIYKSICCLFS